MVAPVSLLLGCGDMPLNGRVVMKRASLCLAAVAGLGLASLASANSIAINTSAGSVGNWKWEFAPGDGAAPSPTAGDAAVTPANPYWWQGTYQNGSSPTYISW